MRIFIVLSSRQSLCENSLSSCDEYGIEPGGRQPLNQANQLQPQARLYIGSQQTVSTTAIYYHYSARKLLFYRPTEGRRLNQPQRLLLTDNVYPHVDSHIQVLTGPERE